MKEEEGREAAAGTLLAAMAAAAAVENGWSLRRGGRESMEWSIWQIPTGNNKTKCELNSEVNLSYALFFGKQPWLMPSQI